MKTPIRFFFVILFLLFSPAHSGWAQGRYQAENAQDAQLSNAYPGSANGVGYASLPTWSNAASVTFTTVTVADAKTYAVAFRYANGQPWAARLSIYLNEVDVTQAFFPSTTAWGIWATQTVTLALRQGSNKIMMRYDADDSGGIDLDYIQVNPDPLSAGFKTGAAPTAGWFPQEISVDKFTGTAHLYLPLHTVQISGVALPIGLSYAATGVKVNDRGGKVGVNWSLTGGVSISREVRGLPDDIVKSASGENRYGWLRYPAGNPKVKIDEVPAATAFTAADCTNGEAIAMQKLTQIGSLAQGSAARDMYDTEPDVFYYSLPGHSGKFVFDEKGKARTIPYDAVDITYTALTPTTPAGTGITTFYLRTAEGTLYTFGEQETMTKRTVNVIANPTCLLREYWLYKLPGTAPAFSYAYAWQASSINTVAGDYINFVYITAGPEQEPAKSSRRIVRGVTADAGVAEYQTETTTTKKYLTAIVSPTTGVQFQLSPVYMHPDEYFVQSVDVTSGDLTGALFVRKYLLDYQDAEMNPALAQGWYDSQGSPLDYAPARRFLRRVRVANGCSTQPLYEFTYDQLVEVPVPNTPAHMHQLKSLVALPPIGVNDQDYWGFYAPNGSRTLIPQLYVYPQLLAQSTAVPAAPYRLYEITGPALASGGFTLPGADRRPSAYFDFQPALAGTLTSMALPGGGTALLEYEPHRFYDPEAQQSYPAGGTRIHAIRVQDPVTGIEARREYGYQETVGTANGRASGTLLRAPRFAFALPSTSTSLQQQWTDATIRCGEDLSEDPFEDRALGYHQVSEQMTGTGQIVTVFNTLGSADDNSVAADAVAGINFTWTRSNLGIARQQYYTSVSGNVCPSVAPLQGGTDLYPFAPATNYDFRRGLPQSITYLSEPGNGTSAAVVRNETFAYEYRDLAPAGTSQVIGLAYEQFNSAYAYAKYPILTEFLYAIRHRTELVPTAGLADNRSETWYNYNLQGWLAAQGRTNSDGKSYRTRYKYLTDYPLTGTAATTANGALFQAMKLRFAPTGEHIGATPVETISEVVFGPTDVRFAGATLNTFAVAGPSVPTRPYQALRWQPAAVASGYDSTRVAITAAGAELHISPDFRVASTLLETGPRLMQLSTRAAAGRQLSAVHLGYGNTLPVLQIVNALASEVVFSDFESTKSFGFTASAGAVTGSTAARTGRMGVALASDASVSAALPSSAADSYRLSFWARPTPATAATTLTVSITGGTPAAQTVTVAPGTATWQLYELILDLRTIPKNARTSYSLQIVANSAVPNAAVQLDDILFLPVGAAAASTTYDLTKGKTSETDGRGRTTFYEYDALGDLARVRDHNGAIVKQVEKIVAGRVPQISPSFVIGGEPWDGSTLTFTASTDCGNNLSYSWDFGDGTSAQGAVATHSFNTTGHIQSYTVTLSASTTIAGQNKIYTSIQTVEIRPAPISISSCKNGTVSIDNCGLEADQLINTCSTSNSPQTNNNTYTVMVMGVSNLSYSWSYREAGGAWGPLGQTGSSITVPVTGNPITVGQRSYRCSVLNSSGVELGVSEVFSIQRYNSQTDPNPNHFCPTQR